jgi:hypothetical protein
MDCYKFLGTPLKVHYVMAIKKLSLNAWHLSVGFWGEFSSNGKLFFKIKI